MIGGVTPPKAWHDGLYNNTVRGSVPGEAWLLGEIIFRLETGFDV